MKIHAIGNSHVNIFTGTDIVGIYNDKIPLFKTYQIGPTIAYNFFEHHYPTVLEYLSDFNEFNKETDYVSLIVGEVDCRWHLLKQAEIQKKPIESIVKECVDRFFRCYLDLQEKGYNVISWGSHPSTVSGHNNNLSCPVYGNCLQRNKITKMWNAYIKEKSDDHNIKFLSLFDHLIKDDGMTDMQYMLDYCHLKSTKVLPFLYKELRNIDLLPKEMAFTFGIITDGTNDDNLKKIIESIKSQYIPQYEIIVVGNTNINTPDIINILFDETQKYAWITRKKNLITQNAKYENIVYMHDYIKLDNNWYSGWLKYGDQFYACMNKIENFDGTRYRDWTLLPSSFPDITNNLLIPYTETRLSKYMYFSGAYWVAKKSVMVEFPLDESRSWGDGEDVTWSKQFTQKYNFEMNAHSKVIMLKYKNPVFNIMSDDMYKYIILPTMMKNIDLQKGPKEYHVFSNFCKEAAENDHIFKTFKQDPRFTNMLEHVSYNQGIKYLEKLISEYDDLINKINWNEIQQNDTIGEPAKYDFAHHLSKYVILKHYVFSPSTLRYLILGLDILKHISKYNKTINIVEIGGGYGAQANILNILSSLFDIKINQYTILDTEYLNILQSKYLKSNNIACTTIRDFLPSTSIDLVISNYYLASQPFEYKEMYIPILKQSSHGFFIWNTSDKVPIINKQYFNCSQEIPQTGLINKCITF